MGYAFRVFARDFLKAARRYERICQLCPEDIADLEDRVRLFVA
jgi:hypothetical protein